MTPERKEEAGEYLAFAARMEKTRPPNKWDGGRLLDFATELLAALDEAEQDLERLSQAALRVHMFDGPTPINCDLCVALEPYKERKR